MLKEKMKSQKAMEIITAVKVERSEEHTSELQSPCNLVCRLLLEKKTPRRLQIRLNRAPRKHVLAENRTMHRFPKCVPRSTLRQRVPFKSSWRCHTGVSRSGGMP